MTGRTATQKTRAAIGYLLNDGAPRRHWRSAKWIGRAEYRDDRQTHSTGYVHCTRIIANEEMTLRKQRRQIGNRGFPGEINRRPAHFRGDGCRDAGFGGGSKEDHVRIRLGLPSIGHLGKSRRRPAFRRAVRCAGSDSDSHRALADSGLAKKLTGAAALLFWNAQADE